MEKSFTDDLLVKYLYKEATPAEMLLMEENLLNNWELRELHRNLEKSMMELPKVQFAPKDSTIQNILRYSNEQKAYEPQL